MYLPAGTYRLTSTVKTVRKEHTDCQGVMLLGVKAVIAESFERIHRSNLVNMGVLPLQFKPGASFAGLGLSGRELYDVRAVATDLRPMADLVVVARRAEGGVVEFPVVARIDTPEELAAYRAGGILPYVLRQLARK